MALPFMHYARVVWFQLAKPRLWQWSTVFVQPTPGEQAFRSFFPFSGSGKDFLARFAEAVQPRLLFSSADNTPEFRSLLTSVLPESTLVQQANDVLLNRFAVFGTTPINFGETIDWHRDYRTGHVWARERYDRIDILSGEGSDMKFPAEVSKFHRLNWLGMASWLTADEKYAHKFAAEVTDWIGANPVNVGINWTVPLEIAIRAVNWICAYSFFYPSRAVPDSFWMLFLRTLYAHGLFLEYNLEYVRVPGNHFASNCLGLIALGSFFGDTKAGRRWLQMGCDFLAGEILRQNTPDGVNFEKSVPYHRFVTEIFTLALLFADKAGKSFPQSYRDRLESMYEYMASYTRPDGSAPMIGDADNGRIIRFHADENFNTHTDNLAVGAALFNRPDFVPETPSPDALFLCGLYKKPPYRTSASSPRQKTAGIARHYTNGGYIIHGSATHHLILDVGDYGKNGRGGHGHNDCLSFELWLHGHVAITDSGTGVYTANTTLRNRLRSTRAHNTVMYDNLEQVEYAGVWQIRQDETRPDILDLTLEEHYLRIVMEHYGYASRREAIHRRTMTLTVLDGQGELVIHDEIIMANSEKGRSFYHVPPGTTVTRNGTTLECSIQDRQFTLQSDQQFTIEKAPYSPLYGVTEECTEISLPCENTVTLLW